MGVVVDVYDDSASHLPTWLAISTGFFGTRIGVAPIRGACLVGGDVVLVHEREVVEAAPTIAPHVSVSLDDGHRLVAHYLGRGPDPVRCSPQLQQSPQQRQEGQPPS